MTFTRSGMGAGKRILYQRGALYAYSIGTTNTVLPLPGSVPSAGSPRVFRRSSHSTRYPPVGGCLARSSRTHSRARHSIHLAKVDTIRFSSCEVGSPSVRGLLRSSSSDDQPVGQSTAAVYYLHFYASRVVPQSRALVLTLLFSQHLISDVAPSPPVLGSAQHAVDEPPPQRPRRHRSRNGRGLTRLSI